MNNATSSSYTLSSLQDPSLSATADMTTCVTPPPPPVLSATNNATWSPEGDRIAYQSERDGNLDIYSYDFNENKEYRVTDYEGIDSGPTWDCGGTNLAFTSLRDGDANIFQVFWQGGGASNMTIDPATDKWSQWRPSNDMSSIGY